MKIEKSVVEHLAYLSSDGRIGKEIDSLSREDMLNWNQYVSSISLTLLRKFIEDGGDIQELY